MTRNHIGMNMALRQAAPQLRPQAHHINKDRFSLVMIIDNGVIMQNATMDKSGSVQE